MSLGLAFAGGLCLCAVYLLGFISGVRSARHVLDAWMDTPPHMPLTPKPQDAGPAYTLRPPDEALLLLPDQAGIH